MNYRHSFHAGNFADVHKHVVLVSLLQRMTMKASPLLYLDTHAGRGLYALDRGDAQRSGEWRHGIARLQRAGSVQPVIRRYLDLVEPETKESRYPGSPLIALASLRDQDRAVLVERQTLEADALRAVLPRSRHVSVIAGDGYAAVKAQLPPKEKRCLVLIDPPFEDAHEFEALLAAVTTGLARWPQAVISVWYPIKAGLAVSRWFSALQAAGLRKLLVCELAVRARDMATGLNGSGLLIVNPPWQVEEEIEELQAELLTHLREAAHPGDQRVEWLVAE